LRVLHQPAGNSSYVEFGNIAQIGTKGSELGRATEWVVPVSRYEGLEPLLATFAEKVIAPAEGKVKALEERRHMIEAELTEPQ
jgi:hypothetical protein